MKYTADVIEGFIEAVNEHASKPLSDFEVSFMESITDQFERKRWLSERQLEILERIYTEKTD